MSACRYIVENVLLKYLCGTTMGKFEIVQEYIDGVDIRDYQGLSDETEVAYNELAEAAFTFKLFMKVRYDTRLTEMTEPLLRQAQFSSKQKYYEAYKTVAHALFLGEITWARIITLLVYSFYILERILIQYERNEHPNSKRMFNRVMECTYTYFEEYLLHWINSQPNGWLSIRYDLAKLRPPPRSPTPPLPLPPDLGERTSFKRYLSFIALAIIGGLYIRSRLTFQ